MIVTDIAVFNQHLLPEKVIMALDYGQKKIGVALSNQEFTIAIPLKVIKNSKIDTTISQIVTLVKQYKVGGLVVGWPIELSGIVGEQAKIVQRFVELVANKIDIAIYLQDERFSTKAANNYLKSFGINRKERVKADDMSSASLILETALANITRMGNRLIKN